MRWVDLAFLHWPVPPEQLRELIPAALELDLRDGAAWVAVTPFRMTRVRPFGVLPVPTATDFPELNVRTYVRHAGRAGVWFFSLDAASWVAVLGARMLTGLPYYFARMRQQPTTDGVVYESAREHYGAPAARFRARYAPSGDVFRADPESLEYWLTERYSLFVEHMDSLLRLDIEHVQWPLQPGVATVEANTMASVAGIGLPSEAPHVLFARVLDVVANWPKAV